MIATKCYFLYIYRMLRIVNVKKNIFLKDLNSTFLSKLNLILNFNMILKSHNAC